MSHYFINDDNIKSKENIIKVYFKEKEYNFIVDNGVFSKNRLDLGTKTLLEAIDFNNIKGNILDFGCGWGPIGIIIKNIKDKDVDIDMIDVNLRSINLAIKNAKLNNVIVNIFESDIYSNVTKKYDYIITNPPIRVGKKVLYKILFDAENYLNDNGQLWLVISKNQGAKSLYNDLRKNYDVSLICKNKEFYVYKCLKH